MTKAAAGLIICAAIAIAVTWIIARVALLAADRRRLREELTRHRRELPPITDVQDDIRRRNP